MHRVPSTARPFIAILAAILVASCSDNVTEPTSRSSAAHMPVALATASTPSGAEFTTDKDDYMPGDTLRLSGTGWQPGDSLDIHLDEEPQNHAPLDWMVGVDENGRFQDSSYIVQESDLGVTFALTATSRATGETTTANFTDGQPQTVTLTPTSRSVPPGTNADYDVAVAVGGNSGDCSITLEVTSSPSGSGFLFTGGPTTFTMHGGSPPTPDVHRTLTFTTGSMSPGSYTFTVRATRGAGCQGTLGTGPTATGTLIVFGPAAKLAFGQQPTSTTGGATITPAVTVRVLDAVNNVVPTSSASITLAFGNNPGSGTLGGTLTQSAASGVATFSGLSVDKIGSGYTLAATSTGLAGATSSAFNITLGAAAKVIFTTQPAGAVSGTAFTTQPVLAVTDLGGNPRTTGPGSGATIALSIVSGTGTSGAALTGCANLTASAGVASVTGCSINLAGTGYQLFASTVVSGSTFTATSSAFDVTISDNSAPDIDCTVPDNSVWYDADVSVHCTASDPSGLKNSGDASFNLSTSVAAGTEPDNAATDTHQACDIFDHCATAGPYAFKVDKKNPTFSCGSADGQWHAADVSIACTAGDGGSGLANSGDASFNLSTSVGTGTETGNASTGTHNIADAVGHSVTAGPISGNMVDKKKPQVSCGSADGIWHAANVSIGCTASDGGSGLASSGDASFTLSTIVLVGNETNDALTGSHNVADAVGNSATAGPISGNKVDRKKPQVSCGVADGLWHATNVSVECTATDGGSGLANGGDASFSLSTSVDLGDETDNASTGTHAVEDAVGNSATGGPISGNKVDRKGPTVNLVCPATPVILNSTAAANWTATDGGSGVASGYGSGSINLLTNSVGQKTATAPLGTSHDDLLNDSPVANCTYNVIYLWDGFFQPVDNNSLNQAKAGSAIPVKFDLGGNQGLSIFATGSPSSTPVACGTIDDNIDLIEETVNAGGSSLTYDNTAHQYIYVWKSDKSWAGTCRRLDVKLNDGTTHKAYFKWTK